MAWSNNLFYLAFLSQIFLLSYYLPNKLLARMQHILASYPPATYPKLYPKPVEYYKLAHLLFKYGCRCVLLVGLLILVAVVFWVDHSSFADDGFISEMWPAAYGMLQFMPLLAIELSECGHARQMRKLNAATKRVADLRRRSLTDLVSPRLLGMAMLLLVAVVLFDIYAHGSLKRSIVLVLTNGLLALSGSFVFFGRQRDPHQAMADRNHRISVNLTSLLYVSMALSVFIAIGTADELFNLDAIDALVMSIYFQVVALLSLGYTVKNIKPDEIDFDVYKNGEAAA
jgi:hypothetical protein